MVAPPTGTVTFVFTDIEGSTSMWERDAKRMQRALARHDEIMRDVVAAHGGRVSSRWSATPATPPSPIPTRRWRPRSPPRRPSSQSRGILRALPPAAQDAIRERVHEAARPFHSGEGYDFPDLCLNAAAH